MKTDGLIFKSHCLDRDVDKAILKMADHFQATRGAIFRLCIESGIAQVRRGVELPPLWDDKVSALRTAYIQVDADERLRVLSYKLRLDHADLRQRVARLGLLTLEDATGFVALQPLDAS